MLVLWDLAQLLPVLGGSWHQFPGQEILRACSALHLQETSQRLLYAFRTNLTFLPTEPNFICPNAMLAML